MDIRILGAAQKYAASRPATEPSEKTASPETVIGKAGADFAATFREAEKTAMTAMVAEADPHALVEALAQTELAVETAVTVRDKIVEAYQEILRMPV